MSDYGLGRRCAICGAAITDDNPDGIGYTCRRMWKKALWDTYYHFRGLDAWKLKVDYWIPIFIDTFKSTKFRSAFKKSFYESISDRKNQQLHISKKQLDIIKGWLVEGEWAKYPFGGVEAENILNGERLLIREDLNKFCLEITQEQEVYRMNCAKKYYGEFSEKIEQIITTTERASNV